MILPSLKKELELIKAGKIVIGVDEVGRGPLAGPVVASACQVDIDCLEKDFENKNLIRDSKTLSEKQREEVFDFIENNKNFNLGVGRVETKTIDRINILNASLLAMRLAVEELLEKIETKKEIFILVDGNKIIPGLKFSQENINKGDQKIFSIAAASVYAKVYRDNLMAEYHQKYPQYGFDQHKGYGTKKHMEALLKSGFCEIHRQSFRPVKALNS
jgi:ribonuclease HII